jgi:CheY-like chemotaxis protein
VQLALIVDDSKTARVMLRKMLDKLHINAEMVDSGEEALEYLKHGHPDVIFMDHMMPGMDGFDAVKAIKADPDKASIPIVMHTTRQGDIYVGQAKALGAVDILSKPTNHQDLRLLLARVKAVTDPQLVEEIPAEPSQFAEFEIEQPSQQELAAVERSPSSKSFYGSTRQWIFTFIWLLPSIWLVALYVGLQQQIVELKYQRAEIIDTLEWSLNRQQSYDYGDLPLSGDRLRQLKGLLARLQLAEFKGRLSIEGHVGDFCLSRIVLQGGSEALMLPEPQLSMSACDVIGESTVAARTLSVQRSSAFSNFIVAWSDPDIRLRIVPYGASSPQFVYPASIGGLTTGDWNAVALSNNRVRFVIHPD